MAAAPSLASLLEQSRKLTSNLGNSRDIPHVELGLDQIESASRKLGRFQGYAGGVSGRMAIDDEQDGGSVIFLWK